MMLIGMKTITLVVMLASADFGLSHGSSFNYNCYNSFGTDALVIEPRTTIYREVQKPFSVYCHLNPKYKLSSHSVIFTKSDLKDDLEYEVVNNQTIKLSLNSTKPDDFRVFCYDPGTDEVCIREIIIGYPPLNVDNFHCISFSWKILQCSYNVRKNPAQDSSSDYSLFYWNHGKRIYGYKCLENNFEDCCRLEGEECWRWGDSTEFTFDKWERVLKFNVTSSNSLGKRSYEYSFDQYKIMVPDPPTELNLKTEGSSTLHISWELPTFLSLFPAGIIHRIVVEACDKEKIILIKTKGEKSFETSIDVEWPGNTYIISVSLRSGANPWKRNDLEDHFWSHPVTKTIKTPPVLPSASPKTTVGAFHISHLTGDRMTVVLYWKDIERCKERSGQLDYVTEVFVQGIKKDFDPIKTSKSYAVYENLPTDLQYTFNVIPINELGKGEEKAVIKVGTDFKAIPRVKFPILIRYPQNETIYLRWFPDSKETTILDRKYTVFWCEDKKRQSLDSDWICEGKLKWKQVGSQTETTLTVQDFSSWEKAKNSRFAVSTEEMLDDKTVSGGMVWSSCSIGKYDVESSKMSPVLEVKDRRPSSALITWSLDCKNWRGKPNKFQVFWCRGKHSSIAYCNAKNESQDIEFSSLELRDLKPNAKYTVWVQVLYSNWTSQLSDPIFFTTSKSGIRVTILVLIGAAIVIGIIISFLIFYSPRAFLNYWNKAKLELNLPTGISKPEPKISLQPESPDPHLLNVKHKEKKSPSEKHEKKRIIQKGYIEAVAIPSKLTISTVNKSYISVPSTEPFEKSTSPTIIQTEKFTTENTNGEDSTKLPLSSIESRDDNPIRISHSFNGLKNSYIPHNIVEFRDVNTPQQENCSVNLSNTSNTNDLVLTPLPNGYTEVFHQNPLETGKISIGKHGYSEFPFNFNTLPPMGYAKASHIEPLTSTGPDKNYEDKDPPRYTSIPNGQKSLSAIETMRQIKDSVSQPAIDNSTSSSPQEHSNLPPVGYVRASQTEPLNLNLEDENKNYENNSSQQVSHCALNSDTVPLPNGYTRVSDLESLKHIPDSTLKLPKETTNESSDLQSYSDSSINVNNLPSAGYVSISQNEVSRSISKNTAKVFGDNGSPEVSYCTLDPNNDFFPKESYFEPLKQISNSFPKLHKENTQEYSDFPFNCNSFHPLGP